MLSDGCYRTAVVQPKAIKAVDVPSIFHKNISPKRIGDIRALNMIVTQDVEAIKVMLPNFKANPFSVWAMPRRSSPAYQST